MSVARKKILLLFTSTLANGGIQRFNRTLLASCQELGIACDVLSLQEPCDAANAQRFGPHVQFRSFAGSKIRFAAALASAIWRGRYECILIGHVNLLQLVAFVALFGWRSTTRLALVAHGIEVWNSIHGLRRLALHSMWRVLCVSHYTKRRILEQAPKLLDAQCPVFPNALGESWVGPHNSETTSTGLPDPLSGLPEKFILSVTRLDPSERYKGILAVLEAISMIEDPSIHYVVAGSGKDVEFLRTTATHFGVGARVHFLQAITDDMLARLYQRCVAFVLPSGKEGFGIVYLEAMFYGAPVIAAREKGALDVVTDGDTGLLVDYGDVVGLLAAIHRIVHDRELRQKVRAGGFALVTGDGKFTFNAFTNRLAVLLNADTELSNGNLAPTKLQSVAQTEMS